MPVLTGKGFMPIESVGIGDLVLTGSDGWKPVLETMTEKRDDAIILHGQGSNGIICAPESMFMAGHRFQGPWDNANRTYPTLFENDGWRSASNMDAHMWLNVGRIPELPIPSLENVVFDEEFFYFVGRFLGDGWVWESRDGSTNQQVGVCCGFRDVESLMPHMKALGWKFSEQDQRTGHYWRCYDKTKFHWFEDNFGRGAINKHLPGWTFGMKKEWRQALLQGYWESDGNPIRNGMHATSISRKLILGIKTLEAGLGRASSISSHEPNRVCLIEGRRVNERTNYLINTYDRIRKSIICDRGYWAHMRKREDMRETITMHALTLEADSYMVDGILVRA